MKQEICEYMRRLCSSGLTTSLGGNISVFNKDEKVIYITPSGVDKYSLTVDDIVTITLDGSIIDGKHKPSIETHMHLSVYKARPDVGSIVHAHPFFLTLFSIISDMEVNLQLTGEAIKCIKKIAYVDYEIMGTIELAKAVEDGVMDSNVLLLRNHGALCCGSSVLSAYNLLEITEQQAQLTYFINNNNHTISAIPRDKAEYLLSL